jgi:hypothetical protein
MEVRRLDQHSGRVTKKFLSVIALAFLVGVWGAERPRHHYFGVGWCWELRWVGRCSTGNPQRKALRAVQRIVPA